MRRILISVILSLYACLFSYSQSEGWQVYLSYSEAVQVEAADNLLYCIMKGSGIRDANTGNLVRYDTEDGSVRTFDSLCELSDKEISHISYNKETGRLLIVYETGNIDLLDADADVVNISALMDNSIPGGSINGICHVGNYAYLCTESAIIMLDVQEGVVAEAYRTFSGKAYAMASWNAYLYVATDRGLFRLPVGANMHDKSVWDAPVSTEVYLELGVYDSHLFGRKERGIDEIAADGTALPIIPNVLTYFDATDDVLVFGMPSRVFLYEGEYTSRWKNIQFQPSMNILDIAYAGGRYYIAEGLSGVRSYALRDGEFTDPIPLFSIDSPRRDRFYHLRYEGGRLLSAGGINTQLAAYYPVTFSLMEEDAGVARWTLFDETTPSASYPQLSHVNSVDLVQDPFDDRHFFGAVSRNGLHEYRMDDDGNVRFEKLYNYENSPLQCIPVVTAWPWNFCTCTSLQYDANGNLWMANQQTDTIVRAMRPNGKWIALYYPEISGVENVYQYLFSTHDINFIVCYEGGKRGFFGFDTNGTLNVAADDRHLIRNSVTNQDGTTVQPTQFFCMAEDRDRQIWCGTSDGLFVITQPRDWFNPDFHFHQIKRNRNDGSGFADYLLGGVAVTCICVDPSNRKWIGTQGEGVFLVSSDGQETIHHFTHENSPLLSNHIYDIAVNPQTGKVMIGTDLGLCSYEGQVTSPENVLTEDNVLAYPNPVRPSTDAMVTITGLTDAAEVKILSASGQVVWGTRSVGGSVRWNCCNMAGERVSSGVYHVVCNTADAGQTVVTRIVVLK